MFHTPDVDKASALHHAAEVSQPTKHFTVHHDQSECKKDELDDKYYSNPPSTSQSPLHQYNPLPSHDKITTHPQTSENDDIVIVKQTKGGILFSAITFLPQITHNAALRSQIEQYRECVSALFTQATLLAKLRHYRTNCFTTSLKPAEDLNIILTLFQTNQSNWRKMVAINSSGDVSIPRTTLSLVNIILHRQFFVHELLHDLQSLTTDTNSSLHSLLADILQQDPSIAAQLETRRQKVQSQHQDLQQYQPQQQYPPQQQYQQQFSPNDQQWKGNPRFNRYGYYNNYHNNYYNRYNQYQRYNSRYYNGNGNKYQNNNYHPQGFYTQRQQYPPQYQYNTYQQQSIYPPHNIAQCPTGIYFNNVLPPAPPARMYGPFTPANTAYRPNSAASSSSTSSMTHAAQPRTQQQHQQQHQLSQQRRSSMGDLSYITPNKTITRNVSQDDVKDDTHIPNPTNENGGDVKKEIILLSVGEYQRLVELAKAGCDYNNKSPSLKDIQDADKEESYDHHCNEKCRHDDAQHYNNNSNNGHIDDARSVMTSSTIGSLGADGLTRKERRRLWFSNYLASHPQERHKYPFIPVQNNYNNHNNRYFPPYPPQYYYNMYPYHQQAMMYDAPFQYSYNPQTSHRGYNIDRRQYQSQHRKSSQSYSSHHNSNQQ